MQQKKGIRRSTMAKQEKEIERWVTVNGTRVPIFKDGSVGGPKELRDKVKTKENERTANQTREEELKSKIKQLEKNAFNKDARAVLNELRARVDEHRRFESDREDMQARLKSLKAKEKELTKTSAFKPEARQTLKELRARIEEIQLMERNDAHELTSYKRKK